MWHGQNKIKNLEKEELSKLQIDTGRKNKRENRNQPHTQSKKKKEINWQNQKLILLR